MTDAAQQPRPQSDTEGRLRAGLLDFIVKYGMIVAVLGVIVYFTLATETFLTATNLLNIIRASSILIIASIGVTLSVAVGGFDVSVGSVASLSSMLSVALIVIWEWHWTTAIGAGLVAGGGHRRD